MTNAHPAATSAHDSALDAVGGSRKQIISWAMWDWGTQPFNTVIITFVFAVYLVSSRFGSINFTSQALAWVTTAAGLLVAVLAPVMGQDADRTGRTMRNLRVLTWLVAVVSAGMFFVYPQPRFLWLGLALLAAGTVFSEFAGVHYNAKLEDVATPQNVGRVSGFGWGMGYLGGIVVLLALNFTFIAPDESDNAFGIRISMVACAVWTILFTLPTFLNLHDAPSTVAAPRVGVVDSYKMLGGTIARLWRTSRQTLYFLIASALFRDGLAGVFAFGAIIAAGTFGFSGTEVIMFGAAANVLAGVSTIAFGLLDDRLGPKRVILISLVALVVAGTGIFFLHDAGKTVFWVLGLTLCLFVGPAQSASRSFLARLVPAGKAGEIFGLYATTGRVISFLSPLMFGIMIGLGSVVSGEENTQYWGILGIVVVLALGLAAMIPVKEHHQHAGAFDR